MYPDCGLSVAVDEFMQSDFSNGRYHRIADRPVRIIEGLVQCPYRLTSEPQGFLNVHLAIGYWYASRKKNTRVKQSRLRKLEAARPKNVARKGLRLQLDQRAGFRKNVNIPKIKHCTTGQTCSRSVFVNVAMTYTTCTKAGTGQDMSQRDPCEWHPYNTDPAKGRN